MNKFHEVKKEFIKNKGETKLPIRSTKGSAGYDIFLKEDIIIPKTTIKNTQIINFDSKEIKSVLQEIVDLLNNSNEFLEVEYNQVLTWTDIAVELDEDKYLSIVPRSSAGTKLGVSLANTEAVIDSDYINNDKTGGNIGLCLKNFGNEDIVLKKGERIAQAKILSYHIVTDDNVTTERTGGFGSSGK